MIRYTEAQLPIIVITISPNRRDSRRCPLMLYLCFLGLHGFSQKAHLGMTSTCTAAFTHIIHLYQGKLFILIYGSGMIMGWFKPDLCDLWAVGRLNKNTAQER